MLCSIQSYIFTAQVLSYRSNAGYVCAVLVEIVNGDTLTTSSDGTKLSLAYYY